MTQLGNGLSNAEHFEDALAVQEAELSMRRRLGDSAESILITQNNLSTTYQALGRREEALHLKRDVYSGHLRLNGEEKGSTLRAANNYASDLKDLSRFEEAKALLRKTMPVARRVLGESNQLTLRMSWVYARALYEAYGATLDDVSEAVTMLEDAESIARRVFGDAHPLTVGIEGDLDRARGTAAGIRIARRRGD